jgi:predicted CopG family antitoxin
MKTITLDEDAYRRLLAWKRAKGDSFSKVIKRVVPEAGTLGAMAQFVSNRRVSEAQDAVLEAVVDERSSAKPDPWT